MKRMAKPLAWLLVVLLLFSVIPISVFADETKSPATQPETAAVEAVESTPASETTAQPTSMPQFTPNLTAESMLTPDLEASATPLPMNNPINLEYEVLTDIETGGIYLFPVPYGDELTQEYSDEHPAWDIAAELGSPVVAAEGGIVTEIQIWDGTETGMMSYGHMVTIQHEDGKSTLYAHLSEINVSIGDTIVRSQRIGRVGSTGSSTGPHLHFEVILEDGTKVDPDPVLAYGISPLAVPTWTWDWVYQYLNNPDGKKTITDWGVTRTAVVQELTAHQKDEYYLGTIYSGYDHQSPNGDTSYNNGTAGMNCAGFVSYVLCKLGLYAGTADLNTHSASPADSVQGLMVANSAVTGGAYWSGSYKSRELLSGASNYCNWIINGDLKSYAFKTKAEMLASGILEKGDLILMLPTADSDVNGRDTHIGFFWGDTSSEDEMWHSGTHPNSGNQISSIIPKATPISQNYFVVIKYAPDQIPLNKIRIIKFATNIDLQNEVEAGAQFEVYLKSAGSYSAAKETERDKLTTGTDGTAITKDLPCGTYVIHQTKGGAGRELAADQEVTISEDKSAHAAYAVTIVNKLKTGSLKVQKASEDGVIKGLQFRVTCDKSSSSFILTTGADGTATANGLPVYFDIAGSEPITYTVTEINTPAKYRRPAPQSFTLLSNQTVTVRFENKISRGSLQLLKVDQDGTTPLEGAVYEIMNADGEAIATETTNAEGKVAVEDLLYGAYAYREIKAPKGYDLDDTVYEFTIEQDAQVVEITRENTPSVGSIAVTKVDTTGNPMSGVSFLLEFSTDDGKMWNPVTARSADSKVSVGGCSSPDLVDGVLTTGEDGIAAFTGLQIDNQTISIRYRLTEIATREGNILVTTSLFDGSLPVTDGDTEIADITITAVNNRNFELPSAGGHGFLAVPIGTALALVSLICVAWFILCARKAR